MLVCVCAYSCIRAHTHTHTLYCLIVIIDVVFERVLYRSYFLFCMRACIYTYTHVEIHILNKINVKCENTHFKSM